MNEEIKEKIERLQQELADLDWYYDLDRAGFEYEAGPVRDEIAELRVKLGEVSK